MRTKSPKYEKAREMYRSNPNITSPSLSRELDIPIATAIRWLRSLKKEARHVIDFPDRGKGYLLFIKGGPLPEKRVWAMKMEGSNWDYVVFMRSSPHEMEKLVSETSHRCENLSVTEADWHE